MGKYTRIFGIAIAAMFFVLGGFVLFGRGYAYIPKEYRVIFAIFLFLYGAYRMVRYLYKDRNRDDE
jgi:hypothetical protein